MATDPYAICPCGSGKKFKWCCLEIHDQIRDLPGSTPARQLLVKRALEYLDSLAKERGDDPSLVRELAAAYQKVGDVQGNPFQPNLGDIQGGWTSYRKAPPERSLSARSSRRTAPQQAEL